MSEEHTRTIEETTQLLYLSVDAEREKVITASFERLLEHFAVMNRVSVDEKDSDECKDDGVHVHGVLRDGTAQPYENTQELVERSEEHEAQYILIPNVL